MIVFAIKHLFICQVPMIIVGVLVTYYLPYIKKLTCDTIITKLQLVYAGASRLLVNYEKERER